MRAVTPSEPDGGRSRDGSSLHVYSSATNEDRVGLVQVSSAIAGTTPPIIKCQRRCDLLHLAISYVNVNKRDRRPHTCSPYCRRARMSLYSSEMLHACEPLRQRPEKIRVIKKGLAVGKAAYGDASGLDNGEFRAVSLSAG